MEKIYFDYQLIIDNVEKRENMVNLINQFDNYLPVYSPAHIEEIARGSVEGKLKKDISKYFKFISDLTNDNELIYGYSHTYDVIDNVFNSSKGILLVNEKPVSCYKRVIKYLHKNELSEVGQLSLFDRSSDKYLNMSNNEIRKEKARVNNQGLDEVFRSDEVLTRLSIKIVDTLFLNKAQENLIKKFGNVNLISNDLFLYLMITEVRKFFQVKGLYIEHFFVLLKSKNLFEKIKSDFSLVENFIQNIMAILSEEGFYFEDNKDKHGNYKRLISRIHDTTHCIYASFSDYFVTRDRRLYKKVEFIYKFLNVPTKVIYADNDNEWVEKLKRPGERE